MHRILCICILKLEENVHIIKNEVYLKNTQDVLTAYKCLCITAPPGGIVAWLSI